MLLNTACISCTSMCQVHTSRTTAKPSSRPDSASTNLRRMARFARVSRTWNHTAMVAIPPNMPPTTAKTLHVRVRSSSDTDANSSTVIGLMFGGAEDALKSVAWLHKHDAVPASTQPHPSNACVSRRQ